MSQRAIIRARLGNNRPPRSREKAPELKVLPKPPTPEPQIPSPTTTPEDPGHWHSLYTECAAKAESLTEAGDFSTAAAEWRKAIELAEKISAHTQNAPNDWRRRCMVWEQLGDLEMLAGNEAESESAFAKSREPAPAPKIVILEKTPGPVTPKPEPVDTAIADYRHHWDAAKTAIAARDNKTAIKELSAARGICEKGGSSKSWEARLSIVLSRMGDLHFSAKKYQQALECYEKDAAISRKYFDQDPGNQRAARNLSISLGNLGETRLALGDMVGAAKSLNESQGMRLELCAKDAKNPVFLRDLMVSRTRQANLALVAKNYFRANSELKQAQELAQKLCGLEPGNRSYQKDLETIVGLLTQLAA